MNRYWTIAVILTLAGCDIPPSQTTLNRLNRQYNGVLSKDFFFEYGPPVSQKVVGEGTILYTWADISTLGAVAPEEKSGFQSPDGHYAVMDTKSGLKRARVCEIAIRVDEDGLIRDIEPMIDTQGKWHSSRCSEVFFTPAVK